jgi:hypothetical protein
VFVDTIHSFLLCPDFLVLCVVGKGAKGFLGCGFACICGVVWSFVCVYIVVVRYKLCVQFVLCIIYLKKALLIYCPCYNGDCSSNIVF